MILGSKTKDLGPGIRDSGLQNQGFRVWILDSGLGNQNFDPWNLDSGPGFRILTLEIQRLTLKIGILTLDIRIRGSVSWDLGPGIPDSKLQKTQNHRFHEPLVSEPRIPDFRP